MLIKEIVAYSLLVTINLRDFHLILKQKPRKDSYSNKILNQKTSACTVYGRGLLFILVPAQGELHQLLSPVCIVGGQWAESRTFMFNGMSKQGGDRFV